MDWGHYEIGPTGLSPADLRAWDTIGPPEVVFRHVFHPDLVEEAVRLPNGAARTWVRHADRRDGVDVVGAVGAVCRRDDGRILVAWQWNVGPRDVVAEFPGGGMEPGESEEDAVRRELGEETGLWAGKVEPLGRWLFDNRRSGRVSSWFLCTELEVVEMSGEEDEIATAWLTEEEIDTEIRAGAFLNQSMLAAWALYRAHEALPRTDQGSGPPAVHG